MKADTNVTVGAASAAVTQVWAQCHSVLAGSLDPIVAIDAYGEVRFASDSVLRVFGYTPGELVGTNIRVLMPEPHRSLHDGYLAHYRETGATAILNRTRQFEVVRKDGVHILCDLSVARTEYSGAVDPLFTGVFRDVTEARRAEERLRESERRFHAVFDGTYQHMGLLRPDGTLLEANRAALESIGVRSEDVIGRHFAETHWWTISPAVQDRMRAAVQRAAAGEFVRFETEQRARGDEVIEVDFSMMPVRDADGRVVLLIPEGRNICELKRAQRAELGMLRALATIGESAAVLAHEIKNPITAVNVALRAVADQLGEDHRTVLEDLVGRMQRLEQLMRGTLSFAKPVELHRTPLELGPFLHEALAHLRLLLVKSGGEARVDVEPADLVLSFDPQRMEEVVANLVTNALEARPGTKVELMARARGADACIWVRDDGPGIPALVRGRLFKPFATSKPNGTGLGLPIVKKIVEEHGGTITASTAPAGGACFEIALPGSVVARTQSKRPTS